MDTSLEWSEDSLHIEVLLYLHSIIYCTLMLIPHSHAHLHNTVSPTFQTAAPDWRQQQQQQQHQHNRDLVTRTVSGFADFVTTVGNTVMVFTPGGGDQGWLVDWLVGVGEEQDVPTEK